MSETPNRWVSVESNGAAARELSSSLELPEPLTKVLVSRGYSDEDSIDRFLNPRLSDLEDPYSLPQMVAAVARIWQAIDENETVVVYGDYDADGVVSTALLVTVLRRAGATVFSHLPSREDDGYGFTVEGFCRCVADRAPGLIITVDCGTNNVTTVEAARERGIDVIVTDHHEPADDVADPVALVNPKVSRGTNATALAGVGVAFKLCHAVVKHGRDANREAACGIDLREYLHWVALGTVADIVPLTGENRALVRHGLSRFADGPGPGIGALLSVAGIGEGVSTWDIAFGIAPRINAAGRLGDANLALDLLLEQDEGKVAQIAEALDARNAERQSIEQGMTKWAISQMDKSFDPDNTFAAIVARDNWHVGIVGIVASRLSKRYGRPAVAIAFGPDGVGTGSCRSVPDLNLADALHECDAHLVAHGGHAMAAGLTIRKEKFSDFQEAFLDVCAKTLKGHDIRPVQPIDAWVDLREADERLWRAVGRMEPFGEGNRAPVWGTRGVSLAGQPRILKNEHLKMTVVEGGTQREAIGFGLGRRQVPEGPMDIAFTLDMNRFRGNETLQLKLKDIRPASGT